MIGRVLPLVRRQPGAASLILFPNPHTTSTQEASMIAFTLLLAISTSGPLHLADVMRQARERNPQILAAEARVRAAASSISPAGALDDPMLMLQLWNAPIDFSSVPLMLQLTQNLPLGGKLDARRQSAMADWRAAQSSAAAQIRDVYRDIGKAYFDLYLADRTITVDAEIEKTLRTMLGAAEARVAAGTGDQVDELKAQAEILKVQADEQTAEAQRAGANARLAALLDRDPSESLGTTTEPAVLPTLPPEHDLRQRALTARPELTAAKALIARTEAQLRLTRASRIPDLGLSAGFMHTFGAPMGETRDFLFAGVQGNIPIFFKGKNQPEIDAASVQIEAARDDERALQDRIFAEIAEAYSDVQAEQRLIQLHHQLVPVTRQTLEASLASYAAGHSDFLTVIDSERELQMHQLELAMHLAAYEQHVVDLEHAVGVDLGLGKAAEAGHAGMRMEGDRP